MTSGVEVLGKVLFMQRGDEAVIADLSPATQKGEGKGEGYHLDPETYKIMALLSKMWRESFQGFRRGAIT